MGERLALFIAKAGPRGRNLLPPFTHLGGRGINLQATGCILGGKSQVEILSLNTQLLCLGQLLAKPRGMVPIKKSKAFKLRNKR